MVLVVYGFPTKVNLHDTVFATSWLHAVPRPGHMSRV